MALWQKSEQKKRENLSNPVKIIALEWNSNQMSSQTHCLYSDVKSVQSDVEWVKNPLVGAWQN